MKNSIKVSTQFDFKGESYQPEVVVDLDLLLERNESEPNFHLMLAKENAIGIYTYEFEVLESSELVFSDATGVANDFLEGSHFDLQGFRQHWQSEQQLQGLRRIAREEMGVESLEQQPGLKAALLAAFYLGQQKSS